MNPRRIEYITSMWGCLIMARLSTDSFWFWVWSGLALANVVGFYLLKKD